MSYDKRITDIAAQAAFAAGKNASVAPQLLLADITFVLADAVESGVISLTAIEATRPTAATGDVVKELVEAVDDLLSQIHGCDLRMSVDTSAVRTALAKARQRLMVDP